MVLEEGADDGEAQARPAAEGLGGVEGLEDVRRVLRGDAVPVVAEVHGDVLVGELAPQEQVPAASRHGVAGVDDEVDEDLGQLPRDPADQVVALGVVALDQGAHLGERVLAEGEGLLEDLVEPEHHRGLPRGARVVDEVPGQPLHPLGGLGDAPQPVHVLGFEGDALDLAPQVVGVSQDGGERVVQLVEGAGGELADGGEFVRLGELAPGLGPLAGLGAGGREAEAERQGLGQAPEQQDLDAVVVGRLSTAGDAQLRRPGDRDRLGALPGELGEETISQGIPRGIAEHEPLRLRRLAHQAEAQLRQEFGERLEQVESDRVRALLVGGLGGSLLEPMQPQRRGHPGRHGGEAGEPLAGERDVGDASLVPEQRRAHEALRGLEGGTVELGGMVVTEPPGGVESPSRLDRSRSRILAWPT